MGCSSSKKPLESVLPHASAELKSTTRHETKCDDELRADMMKRQQSFMPTVQNANKSNSKRNTVNMLQNEIEKKELDVNNDLKVMFTTAYKKLTTGGEEMTKEKLQVSEESTRREAMVLSLVAALLRSAANAHTHTHIHTHMRVQNLFQTVDDRTFEDIYCLFDWDGDGSVDAKEFVLTMCLLATPATSYEAEQDLLFAIFDNDGSGTIDRDEVRL